MRPARDWHQWHREYDDPTSSLSHRLNVVREQLDQVLSRLEVRGNGGRTQLVSLCAGDGRDTLPVLASRADQHVHALLVELDDTLAGTARKSARGLGLEDLVVRAADAGSTESFADYCPADVFMLCGVFGNISDAGIERTVGHLPALLAPGASVIWTRGRRADRRDPSAAGADPSEWVRELFASAGFDETAFVRPSDMRFRVGVHTLRVEPSPFEPARLFTFVDAG